MKSEKRVNLLQLSSQLMAENEMHEVWGQGAATQDVQLAAGGVTCSGTNCKGDAATSVNHCMENLRKNNPPVKEQKKYYA